MAEWQGEAESGERSLSTQTSPRYQSPEAGRLAGPRASGIRDGGRVTPCVARLFYSIWMFSLCFHAPTILTTFQLIYGVILSFSAVQIFTF